MTDVLNDLKLPPNAVLDNDIVKLYRFLIENKGLMLPNLIKIGKESGYSIKYSDKYKQFIIKTKDSSILMNYNYDLIDILFNKESEGEKDVETTSHVENLYDGTRIIISFKNGVMMFRTSGSFSNCEYLNTKTDKYEKNSYDNIESIHDLFIKQCSIMKINLDALSKLSLKLNGKTIVLNFILILANTPIPKGTEFQNTILLEKAYVINYTKELLMLRQVLRQREMLNKLKLNKSKILVKREGFETIMIDIIENNQIINIIQLDIIQFNNLLKSLKISDIETPVVFSYKDNEDIEQRLKQLPYYARGFRIIYKDNTYKDIFNPKYEEVIDLRVQHSICPDIADGGDDNLKVKDIINIWRLFQKSLYKGTLQDFYEYYDKEEKYKTLFNFFMDKIDDFIGRLFSLYNYGGIYRKISPNSNVIIKDSKPIPRPFRIIKPHTAKQLDPTKTRRQNINDLLDYTHQEYKKHKQSIKESIFDTKFDEEYLKTNMIFNDFFKSDYENWQRSYQDSDFFFGDLFGKLITPIWA